MTNPEWPRIGMLVSLTLTAILTSAATLPAQGGDPMEEIKAIFAKVEKEMHEIDKLLLNAGTANAAAKLQDNIDSLQKLLESAESKQRSVIDGIEEILKKVPQQNKNQQNQPNQDQNQRDRQNQEQQQQQNQRRDSQTPDLQPQNQDQRTDQEQNQGPDPITGENRDATKPPPEGATGSGVRNDLDREWGELPEYIRKRHMKGETPKIPLRYERFWLEYLRRSSKIDDGK